MAHRPRIAKPIRLTRSNRYESYPILSPDAKTLLYQSNQHGLEAIYSLQLGPEHANEQKLPLDAADRWAHPAFKHRSDAVWLTRYGKTHTELWQILPGAQAPQRALGFPLGAHDASDDPHSEHVWFLLGESAPINLMRRAKSENSADELVARDVLSYRIDTRGLFLIYRSKPDQLWHCTAAPDMRPCKLLPLRIAPGHARNWALSDHAVYFVAPANADDANHWSSRYDFSSQKISTLDVPAPSTSHGLAVARDESMVVTAQLDGLAVDLNWWLAPP